MSMLCRSDAVYLHFQNLNTHNTNSVHEYCQFEKMSYFKMFLFEVIQYFVWEKIKIVVYATFLDIFAVFYYPFHLTFEFSLNFHNYFQTKIILNDLIAPDLTELAIE